MKSEQSISEPGWWWWGGIGEQGAWVTSDWIGGSTVRAHMPMNGLVKTALLCAHSALHLQGPGLSLQPQHTNLKPPKSSLLIHTILHPGGRGCKL